MLTPATLASLRAGFCPGEAVPGLLDGWTGPVEQHATWRKGAPWVSTVCIDGAVDGAEVARWDGRLRLPMNRPECRQRIATVMGVGRRCGTCDGSGIAGGAVTAYDRDGQPYEADGRYPCDACEGTGHLRPPAPARHLLPQSELGELPDALAGQSGELLGCHVARVLAGFKDGVWAVLGPWERTDVLGGPAWVRRSTSNGSIVTAVPVGDEHKQEEYNNHALSQGCALDNGDGTMVMPWPELSEVSDG